MNKKLSLVLMLMSSVALAEETALPTSGICGTDCYWSFEETTNTLKITGNSDGTGVMENYDYWGGWTGTESRPEWDSYKDVAEKIVVTGVSNIGRSAFALFQNVTSLEMDDFVTELENDEFYLMTSLKSIRLSNNITQIKGQSFHGIGSVDSPVPSLVLPESLEYLNGGLYNIKVGTLVMPSEAKLGSSLFSNNHSGLIVKQMYCTKDQMRDCAHALYETDEVELMQYALTDDGVVVYDKKGRIVGKYADKNALGAGKATETYKYDSAGHLVGIFDGNGQRTWGKKIYTVEEAMEVTKNGDKFHVYLTYK